MSDAPFQRAKEIFEAAMDLPAPERDAYFQRECAGDADLLSFVRGMLAANDLADRRGFLTDPTAESQTNASLLLEGPGARIGPYKLLQTIGEGGFGVVYMAEQTEPVVRRVALKIIKVGMDTRQVIARFEAERQALAMMDHPNIARVLDAGATQAGRPYFAMELVRGDPITAYCDRENLSVDARLALFTQVCNAVQHAHQKGIIHRDIKPSNVLVTVQDGKPVPKVIDFGIAKATISRLTEKTLFTEHRALIGTPEYMSPEQADTGATDIDTRSDIYSLGVLLYELLTGVTPLDGKTLRSAAFAEMQRIIREVEPPKPSTRLSTLASLASVAACRQVEPRRMGALMRGDLDWIVMKCLEKDRSRRYETASALGADVQRHLVGEAVIAAPPSAAYRVRKFVHRRRGVVGAGAVVLVALLAGLGGTLWQAGVARREAEAQAAARRDADHNLVLARKVYSFLKDTLEGVEPSVALGRDTVLLRGLMDSAAVRIESGELKAAPEAELELRETIGEVYQKLGAYDRAQAMLEPIEHLAKLLNPTPSGDSLQLAMAMSDRAALDWGLGRAVEAERRWRDALAMHRRLVKGDDANVAATMFNLAHALESTDRLGEAEDLYREALAMDRRLSSGDSPSVIGKLRGLAGILKVRGHPDQAEPLYREALATSRRLFKGDHPLVAGSLSDLAIVLQTLGRPGDAEPLLREALEMDRRLYKEDHPELAQVIGNFGIALDGLGRPSEAEPLVRESLAMFQRIHKGDHPDVARTMDNLANVLLNLGRPGEAEPILRDSLAMYQRIFKGDHSSVANVMNHLACALMQLNPAKAEPLLRDTLAMERRLGPGDNHHVAVDQLNLAIALVSLGRAGEAEPLLRDSLAMFERLHEGDKPILVTNLNLLANCLEMLGRSEDSLQARRDALALNRRILPPASSQLASGMAQFGLALLKRGTPTAAAEAEPVLRECLSIREKLYPLGHEQQWLRFNTMSLLGGALAAQAKYADAQSLLVDGYTGLKDDPHVPSAAVAGGDRKREALERVVRLYEAWDKAEPGKGYDAQAARWMTNLGAPIPVPSDTPK
jgi:serine/threonine protein kinase/tetratricopeptide (TPR) repeat protein